jgi:hypothetical protein
LKPSEPLGHTVGPMSQSSRNPLRTVPQVAAATGAGSTRVGRLVRLDGTGPIVDFPGNPHGPVPARSLVQVDLAALKRAAADRAEVLLAFDGDDAARPIILGVLGAHSDTPGLDAAVAATLASGEATVEADGKRLVIEAKQEVVLRCGEASITLKRDGKVLIRGVNVETRASGTNRVKGATVKIN